MYYDQDDALLRSHPDLMLTLHLAQTAAKTAMSYFGCDVRKWAKADSSLVTEADHAVERQILDTISRARPTDSVLTEESTGIQSGSPRQWVIDPIDGTTSFLAGVRSWGTHIALDDHGTLQMAVLTRPTEDACWWAVRGHGAYRSRLTDPWQSRCRLRTSTVSRLVEARIGGLVPPGSTSAEALRREATWAEDEVSVVVALLEGRIDAVLDEGGDAWDQAPATLLVTEAGGAFHDPHGGARYDLGWGLYSNAHLQEELLKLLRPLQKG
ncbi:inositol monophosphatase family protein [Streptomyces sp. ERV7]|uniref:inositol monophosphatase family protein n=1 Tax=Streptomyces sp. ERV7 TaxID=1322334 RepID=UPI00131DCCC4|nr:inositol monophosphatase [Streptomyces sp. ERV7]